jgi:hypothetical protein
MKIIKKISVVFGISVALILIILMLTNPSLDRFKEFLPSEVDAPIGGGSLTVSKSRNWLIYSVFEYHHQYGYEGTYIGIFNNFFPK